MEFLVIVVAVVGIVVFTFGFMVVTTLLEGYVLSVLWRWFMVPILGLPALSVVQAIGIALVVAMLTHQKSHDYPEDKEKSIAKQVAIILAPFLGPLTALLMGWVIHQFM